jgi:hypothetical protein
MTTHQRHLSQECSARSRSVSTARQTICSFSADGLCAGCFPRRSLGRCPFADGARLIIREANGTRRFAAYQIGLIAAPPLGTVLTVVDGTPGLDQTTFSVVLPHIEPSVETGSMISVDRFAVATLRRTREPRSPGEQRGAYAVTAPTGEVASTNRRVWGLR